MSNNPQHHDNQSESTTYLLLRLGSEYYALHSSFVREISRWHALTPVPGAPPTLPGVVNQRGEVLPVVDLRALLSLPDAPSGRDTRYVVAYLDDVGLALLADGVLDLIDLGGETFEPLPPTLHPQRARVMQAVVWHNDQLVAILNLAEVVEMLQHESWR